MGILDRIADQIGELIAPDDSTLLVERGANHLEEGRLEEAVADLRAALAARADNARAAHLLGLALERQGDLAGAETAQAMAVAARADFVDALRALGDLRRRLGQHELAIPPLRRVLEAAPGDAQLRGETHVALGACHLALGRFDRAVRELRKAAALRPSDLEVQSLLGRAFVGDGDLDTARACLERAATASTPDPLALLDLGRVYLAEGRAADAELAYLRAQQSSPSVQARLGLARSRLALGDLEGARGQAAAAVELAGSAPSSERADGEALLAEAIAAAGQPLAALDLLERASAAAPDGPLARVLHEATVRLSLVADDPRRGAPAASRLADDPQADPGARSVARAALALTRLADGDPAAAELLAPDLDHPSCDTLLALAAIRAAAGLTDEAIGLLRRSSRAAPSDPRPEPRLRRLLRSLVPPLPADLRPLLRGVRSWLATTRGQGDLAPEAERIRELLDRPMLLTVMGEFNSGKSTFVNSLIGDEIAPMGIVPTTATINVFKLGAERAGRVLYRDDTAKDLPWSVVGAFLRALDPEEARRIRLVELRCPLPVLERVNIVDTPGLNSILPEHEETAREFIAQADAVVWLFTAGQAGSASERESLERVRAESKKVLGVLNKIDRLDEEERAQLLAWLDRHFAGLVDALVPYSARDALDGKDDAARLARSNRPELDRVLDERFFARADAIKRATALRRLQTLVSRVEERAQAAATAIEERLSRLRAAAAALRADRLIFDARFVVGERDLLRADLDRILAATAREVLDFARPRRWAFGSNEAQPADRDFLVDLAEEQLGHLFDGSRARLAAEVGRLVAGLRDLPQAEILAAQLHLLDVEVYDRCRAFLRGYLRGGRVDEFFTRVLPKLELSEAAVRRALQQSVVDTAVLDDELLAPLRRWSARLFGGLLDRLAAEEQDERLRGLEQEERLARPLAAVGEAMRAIDA